MTLDRLLDRLDDIEKRQIETLKEIGELRVEIAVLKSQRSGIAWVMVLGVNVLSVAVTYFLAK